MTISECNRDMLAAAGTTGTAHTMTCRVSSQEANARFQHAFKHWLQHTLRRCESCARQRDSSKAAVHLRHLPAPDPRPPSCGPTCQSCRWQESIWLPGCLSLTMYDRTALCCHCQHVCGGKQIGTSGSHGFHAAVINGEDLCLVLC